MNPLLEQFLEEARENLAFIEQNIDQIDDGDDELLNSIFRAAHTLKGGSGIVGFEAVKNITHHAEDLLDMLRAGKIEFQPTMEGALFDAFDEVMNNVVNSEHNEIDNLALSLSGKKELSVGVKGMNKEDRLFGTNNPYSKY